MVKVNGFLRMGSQAVKSNPGPGGGSGEITGVRTTLDAMGAISVFLLGPVGAAAARFVMEAGTGGLNIWGVAELQAGLKALQPFGIRADVFVAGSVQQHGHRTSGNADL
jgi:hypothetical protein